MKINIDNSYLLFGVVFIAHLGVMPLLVSLDAPWIAKIALVVFVAASFFWQWRRASPWIPAELTLNDTQSDCLLSLAGETGRYWVAEATAHIGFIRLKLVSDVGRVRHRLLMCDAIQPAEYRELCAWITQGRLPKRVTSPDPS